jgi:hypothetical protein
LLNQQNLNHDGIYSCTGIYFFKSADIHNNKKRTIKNDISNVNQEIGLFGKSVSEIKDIIYDVQTKGFKEVFLNKGTIDLTAYQKYNNLLDLGVSSEKGVGRSNKEYKYRNYTIITKC